VFRDDPLIHSIVQLNELSVINGLTSDVLKSPKCLKTSIRMCVCVCVCVREREKESNPAYRSFPFPMGSC
jgi:hypothetical protein